ncbi:hypothetical protein LTR01_000937 [Friedmanniomyces endolithicus]|nr:hypothetical protein LTR01_000937 [Friedmanniomyces endolithicus]KAK0835996.1 hypothetical protein LTR73_000497 [Friedmanniomyces endolithicus]
MSASFRSHFRSKPSRRGEAATEPSRKGSTRLPTIPTPATDTHVKSKAVQHVSQLAKRSSRSITPADRLGGGTRSAPVRVASPDAGAQHDVHAARKTSVVPLSEDGLSGAYTASALRHKLSPPPISGSSASTFESPRSNMLRKKSSSVDKYAAQSKPNAELIMAQPTTHNRNGEREATIGGSVLGISLPPTSAHGKLELGSSHAWHVTRNVTPPVASAYASSSTPSTRYSDSPFSHVLTPSSASSYSPATFATSGSTARTTPQSPDRSRSSTSGRMSAKPESSRLGLSSVRESSTSSSNATITPAVASKFPARKEVPRKTPSAPPMTNAATVTRTLSSTKAPVSSVTSKRAVTPVLIPPELAHLNVDPPSLASSLQKPLPPIRPSRDGILNIAEMHQQSRVIQSDLPRLYTTYHKRTPSQETPVSATSPGFRQRFGLSSKSSSRQPSPRVDSAISPPPSARSFSRGPTPELAQPDSRKLQRTDSPAVGPAPSPSKSPRFGIFSRKPKVDSDKSTEKPKREPRKGPAAGTGHEGYGRFGFRGRSGSTTSNTDFRSPSADSNASSVAQTAASRKGSFGSSKDDSDFEDFIKERQRPVILRGSGSASSNAASTPEQQSISVFESSNSSSIDSLPKPHLLPSAMRSNRDSSPAKRPGYGKRLPYDSSGDEIRSTQPTLATRRSLTKLSQAGGKSIVRVPVPISTNIPPKQRSVDSYGSDNSAWPDTESTTMVTDNPVSTKENTSLRPQHIADAKPSRKWNFFQRAQASPRPKGKQRATEDPAVVSRRQGPTHGVAHYAVLDEVEPVHLYEVEQILQDNEPSSEGSIIEHHHAPKIVPYERRHSGLLPSPPKASFATRNAPFIAKPTVPMVRQDSLESPELLRAQTTVPHPMPQMVNIVASSEISTNLGYGAGLQPRTPLMDQLASTPELPHAKSGTPSKSNDNSPRQPRLSPIGRIPRVVSRRDRDRKLPDNSFSRPFARAQPHPSVKPPGALYHEIRELASPVDSGSQPVSSTSAKSEGLLDELKSSVNTQPPSVSTNRTSFETHSNNDFITFTPRKGSEVSYSSSSGNGSWIAAMTAPILQLDDPWHEYNDLLDDMLPQKTPISAGSSLGAPFQYASVLYGPSTQSVPTPLYYSQPPSVGLPQPPRAQTVPPSVLSVPQQIARFLQPSMSPLATPHTLSELYDDYGNRSSTPKALNVSQAARNSAVQPTRTSLTNARASMASSRGSRISMHSRSASLPETNARHSQSSLTPSARLIRDTQLLDIAEDASDDQAADANLRFGALMTSKWLSCGRVLFSPAHHEMRLANEPKVLVLDGLGSDFSYWVALTYPAANVYRLGPAVSDISTAWPGINQKPPSNHRHYALASIASAFPFPKGFFTAVLFRFPVATTDEAYQACIYECKRVLRPGGHLEVAVLDLDLNNMGSRARSLVRGLKTRIHQRDPEVSLRCLSDSLVGMIGRRGFEEVQRCVVGVPAAGRIPRSRDGSSPPSDDSGSRHSSLEKRGNSPGKEYNFADLLEKAPGTRAGDQGTESSDEGITKMVAKVGRWWYSSCYERPLLAHNKSIWSDQALLRECEKQGTSFRLLICYAQKPMQTRRRTVSV